MTFNIAGKVALVTGANRGIGKAIVESFLAHGAAKVYLAVRDISSTAELEAKYQDKVQPVALDLSSQQAVSAMAEQAADVDVVVNNAGVAIQTSPLADNIEQSLQLQMDVNVYGLIRIAKAFAPQLEARNGALVQLNSVASLRTNPAYAAYCTSKAASYAITQGLRKEWLDKVTVVSVHPGPIATDMAVDLGLKSDNGPELVAEEIVTAMAAGQFHLYPDDFARKLGSAYQSYATSVVEA
ncbi:SDR family oxidoreductase [Ferrimonas lipolytica]|uniref:SDR family oxidoreductase n=1 Tax=Ferrimonas lipolytica TaxID=2724191 RepID=A0A6H1UEV8_9GAMM|nr:SDR family oxidoreductase [Ferrimonas lipolytica]QIZ77130.1 SDR family oxidoreductase [Ferrimonas lipolytica]